MKEFFSNNGKIILFLAFAIAIGVGGATLAISMQDMGVNVKTGEYNVVYNGEAILPKSTLEPIMDSKLLESESANKIMKITFDVKGAQSNPTGKNLIYDVTLTNLNMDKELKNKYLRWRLYKKGIMLSQGTFESDYFTDENRIILTNTRVDLPSFEDVADEYEFYIWISEPCEVEIEKCTQDMDISYMLNKSISGEIKIELSTEKI